MKVNKIVTQLISEELEIKGATLLSIEEAKKLPLRLREYEAWWWLRSPGYYPFNVTRVYRSGTVDSDGEDVDCNHGTVRPALIIKNLESSNFTIGDCFTFGDKTFEIISENLAFCLGDIGECVFRKNYHAIDANDYVQSDVKKYIDKWFEENRGE